MIRSSYIAFILLVLGFSSCRDKTAIAGFDSKKWKNDKKSCKGDRTEMIADFEKIRVQLYGKDEREIIDVLGRPDSEELYERKQRFYFYYVEPGTQCAQKGRLSEANWIQVRFNSVDNVSEINYKRPVKDK